MILTVLSAIYRYPLILMTIWLKKIVARAMALSANHDYSSRLLITPRQSVLILPTFVYIYSVVLRNITGDLHGKKTDDLLAAQLKDKCNDTEVC